MFFSIYKKDMKELILQQLDCFNDTEFKFDPKFHKYTYHGEQFISVTKFIQKFHKPFETDFWSKKKAEQAGVSQEEILNDWKKLNDYANEVGTDTHQWIEDYFNGIWRTLPSNLDLIHRINKFNKIFAKHPDQGNWVMADLENRMNEPWFDAEGFFIATNDKKIVGFCWTKIHHDFVNQDPIGEIYVVGVDPDNKKNGLGKSLTITGLNYLVAKNLKQAMLYVDADNGPALAMYQGLGFN